MQKQINKTKTDILEFLKSGTSNKKKMPALFSSRHLILDLEKIKISCFVTLYK